MEKQGKFILMVLSEFREYLAGLDTRGMRNIDHVQTHHTWSPSYRNFNGKNHFAKLISMEADHIERGFGQIAQHFTTFPDGTIAVCRSLSLIPTCIHGHNTGGICIENLGNFNTGGDLMSQEQRFTIIHLNALLAWKFKLAINADAFVYHHWFRQSDGYRDNGVGDPGLKNHKTCPGTNFFGGNTVENAVANFLPEIQRAYDQYKLPAKPLQPGLSLKGIVNATTLNIRKGPGTEFAAVGKLHKDDPVLVLETRDDWDRIGEDQWVSADYIALLS